MPRQPSKEPPNLPGFPVESNDSLSMNHVKIPSPCSPSSPSFLDETCLVVYLFTSHSLQVNNGFKAVNKDLSSSKCVLHGKDWQSFEQERHSFNRNS